MADLVSVVCQTVATGEDALARPMPGALETKMQKPLMTPKYLGKSLHSCVHSIFKQ